MFCHEKHLLKFSLWGLILLHFRESKKKKRYNFQISIQCMLDLVIQVKKKKKRCLQKKAGIIRSVIMKQYMF